MIGGCLAQFCSVFRTHKIVSYLSSPRHEIVGPIDSQTKNTSTAARGRCLNCGLVKRTRAQLEEVCRAWNEAYPVGTSVLYEPVAGDGETRIEWTRTKAIVAAGKSAVCWITGHMCALDIRWLQPKPGFTRPAIPTPLLCGSDAFRLILHVNPLMAKYRLAFECVGRCWLNPHTPDFPVLSLHVLERELYFGALMQAESIQEGSDVLRPDDALYMIFRLRDNAEVGLQLFRRCEPLELGRRRRPRWR